MATSGPVWVEGFKWPAVPYRSMTMVRLGDDDAGTWLWAPRGTESVYAAADGAHRLPVDFLTLVPAGDAPAWWTATWMFGHPNIDLYVDVVVPAVWRSPASLAVVDLDLDVVRTHDGDAFVDDEDEFAMHQVTLGYPPDVVAGARAAADAVLAAVVAAEPPFGAPPARWVQAAASGGAAGEAAAATPSPPPTTGPTPG